MRSRAGQFKVLIGPFFRRLYGIGYAVAVEPSQSNMGYIATLKTKSERTQAGQKDGAVAAAMVNIDPLGAISLVPDSVPQARAAQDIVRFHRL